MVTSGTQHRWDAEPRTITVWDTAWLGPTATDRAVLLVAQAFKLVGPDAPVRAASAVRRAGSAEASASSAYARAKVKVTAEGDVRAIEEAIGLLTDAWHPSVRGRAARAAMLLRRLHRELSHARPQLVLPEDAGVDRG
jgi:hypothetical protein